MNYTFQNLFIIFTIRAFQTHVAESLRQRVFREHEMILNLLDLRCNMFLSPCKNLKFLQL